MRHSDRTRDDATPAQIIGFLTALTILALELAALATAILIGAAS